MNRHVPTREFLSTHRNDIYSLWKVRRERRGGGHRSKLRPHVRAGPVRLWLPWGISVQALRTVVTKLRTGSVHKKQREQSTDRIVERVKPEKLRSNGTRRRRPLNSHSPFLSIIGKVIATAQSSHHKDKLCQADQTTSCSGSAGYMIHQNLASRYSTNYLYWKISKSRNHHCGRVGHAACWAFLQYLCKDG